MRNFIRNILGLKNLELTYSELSKEVSNIYHTLNLMDKRFDDLQKKNDLLGCLAEVLNTLGNCESDRNINYSLEEIGRILNTDRVSIFMNTEDNEKTSIIYEWCHLECEEQICKLSLQDIPYEDIERWRKDLNSNKSIFGNIHKFPDNEREILEDQDIKSLFIQPIFVNGKWKGFLALDECKKERLWYVDEVLTIKVISQCIGFLFSVIELDKNNIKYSNLTIKEYL